MKKTLLGLSLCLLSLGAQAGVINPDCTAEKAAKSAAMKATVGVGGRCSPAEAAGDAVNLNDKKEAVGDAKGALKDGKKKVENATDIEPGKKLMKDALKP